MTYDLEERFDEEEDETYYETPAEAWERYEKELAAQLAKQEKEADDKESA